MLRPVESSDLLRNRDGPCGRLLLQLLPLLVLRLGQCLPLNLCLQLLAFLLICGLARVGEGVTGP